MMLQIIIIILPNLPLVKKSTECPLLIVRALGAWRVGDAKVPGGPNHFVCERQWLIVCVGFFLRGLFDDGRPVAQRDPLLSAGVGFKQHKLHSKFVEPVEFVRSGL